jgi:cytochrome c/Fe2+ transport protein
VVITRRIAIALLALCLGVAAGAYAQHQHGAPTPGPTPMVGPPVTVPPPAEATKKSPLRVTMEELHQGGGVPRGWRFSWPEGNAQKGREVFVKLECYQCHAVPGAGFPEVQPDPAHQGPGLAGMGGMHPAEYFAESILNPNAVITTGPGFTGPDGLSIMPDYRDSLTLAETIDLVAYLRSLTGGGHQHGAMAPSPEQVAGDYRVRLTYMTVGAHEGGHDQGTMSGHSMHGGDSGTPGGHLMVFVTDAVSGEPMPYLPVSASIYSPKGTPRTVKLAPTVGDEGFHYGADVALPADTSKITVAIGKPTIAITSSAGRPARAATSATFEWRP